MRGRLHGHWVDIVSIVLGMCLMLFLFFACFYLLQRRDGGVTSTFAPFRGMSAEGLTMICVLLAGLVGGYLQYMRDRFRDIRTTHEQPPRDDGVSEMMFRSSKHRMRDYAAQLHLRCTYRSGDAQVFFYNTLII